MAKLSRLLGVMFAGAARRSALERYGIALLLPLVALAGTLTVAKLSEGPFFPLFSLATIVAAVYGGMRPGLVSAAWCVLLNVVSVPPAFSLHVAEPEDLLRIIAFGIIAGVMAVLIGSMGEIQNRLDIQRQELQVTLRSIGDAVVATDMQGRVTFMNPVAEEATGYSLEEARGRLLQDIFRIINEQTRAVVDNPVHKVLASGRIVGLANHTILIRKDGSEIPIDDSAAPIMNKGLMMGVILVFRDITQSKQREAALLRAEKLASVGRLAATIAHEINNPLESVTNLVYLINSAEDLGTAKRFAEAAQSELQRAAHVTKQTLSFARPPSAREPANMPQLVDSILALYEGRLSSKKIQLVKRYRGDGMALASRSEVRQVVSNLLGNAIDAERAEGRIDVRVSSTPDRKFVRLIIADRGCGMSEAQRRRVFEAFFTTKQDVGTGLGLWVTKQIVDAHGGNIRLRSREGRGTVFAVTWPVTETNANEALASS